MISFKDIAKEWVQTGAGLAHKQNKLKTVSMIASPEKEFQKLFLYGNAMKVMHKGKPKQMQVYLDAKRDHFLWVSSKTKAFLVDLRLSIVLAKINGVTSNDSERYSLILRQVTEQVIFLFEEQKDKSYYYSLFYGYISAIRQKNPEYLMYFSNIYKLQSYEFTKSGSVKISQSLIQDISKEIGLTNKKYNAQTLLSCIKYDSFNRNNNVGVNLKNISQECFDDYFSIHFCNPQIKPIFQIYSNEKLVNNQPTFILQKIMSKTQFKDFLINNQKETEQFAEKVLKKYSNDLSFFDFSRYLYDSELNHASRIQQTPLNFSLKDYFCFSSHNTYLSGNQLTSDSKVQRYSEDLENGLKCVELDIHNDANDRPIVNHAFKNMSLCKPINFQDVIKAIRMYSEQCDADGSPHYPIILSLQNHASVQSRELILEILNNQFGHKIYKIERQKNFPLLSYLFGKIIIKTSSQEQELRIFREKATGTKMSNSETKNLYFENNLNKFSNSSLRQNHLQFEALRYQMIKEKIYFNSWFQNKQQALFDIVNEMTKVTTIFKSKNGTKGDHSSQFECTSLTYSATIQGYHKNPHKFINYTRRSWLRTYPHGTQIASSNYDPAFMLAVGAQIVALNTQTRDYYAWMMQSYFCGGYCSNTTQKGYVLKPNYLRDPDIILTQDNKQTIKIQIKVINSEGEKVTMKFFGLPEDNRLNVNASQSFTLRNPNESFIVFDIGTEYRNCVAIRWLQQGYRMIEAKSTASYMDSGKRILLHIICSDSLKKE